MLQLKVCGMRDVKNIADLIQVQPDFIGLIFHEKSPRNVIEVPNIEFPIEINKVGVFVNKEFDFVTQKISDFKLNTIQLHGTETSVFCEKIKKTGQKVIKGFNIYSEFDFSELKRFEPFCDYFLFDAFGKNAGGNGITFDWKLLNKYKGKTPFFLSGGIDETMASNLKEINHPMFKGVDVNSGFEIEPGLKNIEKIKLFKESLSVIANGE